MWRCTSCLASGAHSVCVQYHLNMIIDFQTELTDWSDWSSQKDEIIQLLLLQLLLIIIIFLFLFKLFIMTEQQKNVKAHV